VKTLRSAPCCDAQRLFRALGDATRLRLLCLLRSGERCVCDLVRVVGLSQPKVSRHLASLRTCGLVLTRRSGLWVYYRLAEPATRAHAALLQCIDACAAEDTQCQCDAAKSQADCCAPDGACRDRLS
jgi:ArsR family transcriptional regulator, arsenate/arsenite/antimonite-responsive transcriptional repressor